MAAATASECCKAFMEWVSRFGVCKSAVSDNGNTFIANLYREIMNTFNIKVTFTPSYHPATNGLIERRHQTIKNSLKASLIDMGNHHGNKWRRALPWVLLGKRIAFQPDLDTSSALLAFGRSPLIPGQLLGEPGPPLTNLQVRALLEELYRLETNPAKQTSSKLNPIDISKTDNVSHVYVKVEEPHGLAPRFEGPYAIVSRPSRSQVQVRVGSYASGEPRLCTYHWSWCKPAHMRSDAQPGERPKLGRPSKLPAGVDQSLPEPTAIARPIDPPPQNKLTSQQTYPSNSGAKQKKEVEPAKIQTERPVRRSRNPNPNYVSAIAA